MKSNLKLKTNFDGVAEGKPQLSLVEKAQTVTATPVPANDELRLDQYRRQNEMLQEALKNAASAPTAEMLAKLHQPARYSADRQETIEQQAAQQENGGSIFSSAYSRFYFV